jgi:hypothetical protein
VAAADGEVGAVKLFASCGARGVGLFVVDAAEELGVGGGTASGDGGKGAALAEEAAEVEGFAGIGGDLRFVQGLRFAHGNSRTPKPAKRVRLETIRFIDTK